MRTVQCFHNQKVKEESGSQERIEPLHFAPKTTMDKGGINVHLGKWAFNWKAMGSAPEWNSLALLSNNPVQFLLEKGGAC